MAFEAQAIHGVNYPTGPDLSGIRNRWSAFKNRFGRDESILEPSTMVDQAEAEILPLAGHVLASSMQDSLASIATGNIINRRHITVEGKEWADTVGRDVLFRLQQHHGRDEITETEFSNAMSSMYAAEKATRLNGLKKGTPAWVEAKAELANLNRVRASACGSYVSGRLYGKDSVADVPQIIEETSKSQSRMRQLGLVATALLGIFGANRFMQQPDTSLGQHVEPNPMVRDAGVYGDALSHSMLVAPVQEMDTKIVETPAVEESMFPVGQVAQARFIYPDGRVEELGSVHFEASDDYFSLVKVYGEAVAPKKYDGTVEVNYGNGTKAQLMHSAGSDNGIVLKTGPAYALQQMVARGESIEGVQRVFVLPDGTIVTRTFHDAMILAGDTGRFDKLPYNPDLNGRNFEVWCQEFQMDSPLWGRTTALAAAVYDEVVTRPGNGEIITKGSPDVGQRTSRVIYSADMHGRQTHLSHGYDASRNPLNNNDVIARNRARAARRG